MFYNFVLRPNHQVILSPISHPTHRETCRTHHFPFCCVASILSKCANGMAHQVLQADKESYEPCYDFDPVFFEDSLTRELISTLTTHKMFPTKKDKEQRAEALAEFIKITDEWAALFRKENNQPHADVKVFTIGSYRLETYTGSGDIDLSVLSTCHFIRDSFFDSFLRYLKSHPSVRMFRIMEESSSPTIKLYIKSIKLDAAFSVLPFESIPNTERLLHENKFVKNLNEKCLRSFNSWRDAEFILSRVKNLDEFRIVVRAIKLWSGQRAVKSNAMGFLSSIAWCILVAKTCLMFPELSPGKMLIQFFKTFSQWQWPDPVRINYNDDEIFDIHVEYWNQSDHRKDLMPILTPAFPRRNNSLDVNKSTFCVIMEELLRGKSKSEDVERGKIKWDSLFHNIDFFKMYQHFYAVSAECTDDWFGLVMSRIKMVVSKLESNHYITKIHPFTARFRAKQTLWPNEPLEKNNEESDMVWLIGMDMAIPGRFPSTFLEVYDKYFKKLVQFCRIWDYGESYRVQSRLLTRKELLDFLYQEEIEEYGYDAEDVMIEPPLEPINSEFFNEDWGILPASVVPAAADFTSRTKLNNLN